MNNIPEDSMLRRHYLTELKNRVEENESWLSRKIKEIREHKLIQILKYKVKK